MTRRDDIVRQVVAQLAPMLTDVAADASHRVSDTPIPMYRPGTVQGFDPDTGDAFVIIDGDDTSTPVQNTTGSTPAEGDRVMVQFSPPHGVSLGGWVGGAGGGGGGGGTGPPGPPGGTGPPGLDGVPGRLTTAQRLIISGHSYPWDDLNTPYGGTNVQNGDETRDSANFAALLRDAVVGNAMSTRYATAQVPACLVGTAFDPGTVAVVTIPIPEDTVIEGIWYYPNQGVTGQNTNTRRHEIKSRTFFGDLTFGFKQYDAGIDLEAGLPAALFLGMGGTAARSRGTTGALYPFSPHQPSVVYPSGASTGRPNVLTFTSIPIANGLADPGGTLLVRLGGRYRNLAQGGALLLMGGAYLGGWGAQFTNHRASQAFGVEINVATTAALGATLITVDGTAAPVPAGWEVEFSNGVTATVSAASTVFDTTLTVNALSGAVPAGEQGFAKPTSDGRDAYLSEATHVMCWGINDSAWWVPQDRPAWRETVRAVIALASCPYMVGATRSNIRYTGAGWEDHTQPAGGQWVQNSPYGLAGANKRYSGAAGGTFTIKVAPDFPGGAIDLFFAALAGTGNGGRISITVDGGTAKILDTSSASATANIGAITGSTLTGVTFLTGTGYNSSMIGRAIEHPGVPVGTVVGFVNDAGTAITLTNPTTGAAVGASSDTTGAAGSIVGYCPMVKRLTGLIPGAHTIVGTVTGMDATDGTAQIVFLGPGIETPTPVLFCNVAHLPNGFATTEITNQNTDTTAVLAGTAAPVGTSTAEPALSTLVEIADIDTILNGDPANFLADSLHPNATGHRLIAEELMRRVSGISGGAPGPTLDDPGAFYGNGILSTFTHVHGLDTDWVIPHAWNTVTRQPENVQVVSIDTTSVQVTVNDVPPTNGLFFRCSR